MLLVAPLQPWEVLAHPNQMLVSLQNHHECQLVGHEVFCHYLLAVGTFLAFGVSFNILLWLLFFVRLVVVHRDGLDIDLAILLQDEGLHVDKPPVATLIFDEIAYKLLEGYL